MAALSFNLSAYAFERGMTALWDSYRAAEEAVASKAEGLRTEFADYERRVAAGDPRQYEYEDDGTPLYEYGQLYEINLEDAEEAVAELRNAFVVAFYHHWERGAQRWGNFEPGAQPKHPSLIAATEKLGIAIPSRLEGVHHLVNLLKHGGQSWGEKLKVSWPEVVSGPASWGSAPDWRRAVSLSADQVAEVHKALKEAAPPALVFGPMGQ